MSIRIVIRWTLVTVGLLTLLPTLSVAQGAPRSSETNADEGVVPGEVLVWFEPAVGTRVRKRMRADLSLSGARSGVASFDAIADSLDVERVTPLLPAAHRSLHPESDPGWLDAYRVEFAADVPVLEALAAFRADPNLAVVQANFLYAADSGNGEVPDDPELPNQWAHDKTNIQAAWDSGETGHESVVIAILGTGILLGHEDLVDNIWVNSDEVAGTCDDFDSNGFPGDTVGWDFFEAAITCGNGTQQSPGVLGDPNPNPWPPLPGQDPERHETEVAGVAAAATNNCLGIAGVCWNCKIMPLRVGVGSYTTGNVLKALNYATFSNDVAPGIPEVDVINMSFGSYEDTLGKFGPDTAIETAVQQAFARGIVLVGSAGNDWARTQRFPAAFDEVIAVAATDEDDMQALFGSGGSNFGRWVTIAAPGANILTTTIEGPDDPPGTLYREVNGTSMAAPYVAGAAALVISQALPLRLPPATVRQVLQRTADPSMYDAGDGTDPDHGTPGTYVEYYIGSGRVDVGAALAVGGIPPSPYARIEDPDPNDAIVSGMVTIVGDAIGMARQVGHRPWGSGGAFTPIPNSVEPNGEFIRAAIWNTAGVPRGWHEVRLLAGNLPGVTDEHVIRVWVQEDTLFHWDPVEMLMPDPPADFEYASEFMTGPTLWDLDDDGSPQVVLNARTGVLNALESDGTSSSSWPFRPLGSNFFQFWAVTRPAVGDLDGDGLGEVVTTASHINDFVTVKEDDGTGGTAIRADGDDTPGGVVLGNLDLDEELEVVVVSVSAGRAFVQAWDLVPLPFPNLVELWPAVELTPPHDTARTTPAIGDLDGDCTPEIIVRSLEHVSVVHHDGTLGWQVALPPSSRNHSAPVLADFTDGPEPEIVVAGEDAVHVLRGDGTLFNSMPNLVPGSFFDRSRVSVADLSGDTIPEAFLMDVFGNVHRLQPFVGFGGWPTSVGAWVPITTRTPGVSIADVDGDGSEDVLVGGWDHYLHAWNASGMPLAGFPIFAGGPVRTTPLVADLDCDGDVEVVIGTNDRTESALLAYELPSAFDPDRASWIMSRGSPSNAGLLVDSDRPWPAEWIDVCSSNPCVDGDGDGDEVCDGVDNCPTDFNPSQEDGDQDGLGNACDPICL